MDKRKVFNIDVTSDEDNTRYQGTFTTKKLSFADKQRMEARKLQLNGGYYYDPEHPGVGASRDLDQFNWMLAHLEVAIVSAPKWWDLQEISDPEVVRAVYAEVTVFENSFRRGASNQASNESNQSSSGSSSPQSQAPNNGMGATQVVGKEVQASLDP